MNPMNVHCGLSILCIRLNVYYYLIDLISDKSYHSVHIRQLNCRHPASFQFYFSSALRLGLLVIGFCSEPSILRKLVFIIKIRPILMIPGSGNYCMCIFSTQIVVGLFRSLVAQRFGGMCIVVI